MSVESDIDDLVVSQDLQHVSRHVHINEGAFEALRRLTFIKNGSLCEIKKWKHFGP